MKDHDLPLARDWMTKRFVVLRPDDEVYHGIERLQASGLASAPVVDQDGAVVGVFTEKDAIRALSQILYDEDTEPETVGRHMSRNVRLCELDWDLFRVTELFLSSNFPGLPVVEGGRLVGVIQRKDHIRGIRAFRERLERARRTHEAEAGRQADRPRGVLALNRAAAAARTREQLVRLFGRFTS